MYHKIARSSHMDTFSCTQYLKQRYLLLYPVPKTSGTSSVRDKYRQQIVATIYEFTAYTHLKPTLLHLDQFNILRTSLRLPIRYTRSRVHIRYPHISRLPLYTSRQGYVIGPLDFHYIKITGRRDYLLATRLYLKYHRVPFGVLVFIDFIIRNLKALRPSCEIYLQPRVVS
jgi:hypothetical protein